MATTGTEKYSRIALTLVKGGTKLARKFLEKRIKDLSPPGQELTIDEFLRKHERTISQRTPGKNKKYSYFPQSGSTNLEQWDLHMFCFILLETCELTPTLRMRVEKLQTMRNKLCHMKEPTLDGNQYIKYTDNLKICFEECLTEIDDQTFTTEIKQLVELFKSDHLGLEDAVKLMHKFYHMEVEERMVLEKHSKEHRAIMDKLEHIQSRLPPDVHVEVPGMGIIIEVKNCTTDKETEVLDVLVNHFNDMVNKEDFHLTETLSNSELNIIREVVQQTFKEFLKKGRHIVKVENKCVMLTVRCESIKCFVNLLRDYMSEALTRQLHGLQSAIRSVGGYEDIELEAVIYKDEFWDVINCLVAALDEQVEPRKGAQQSAPFHDDNQGTSSGTVYPVGDDDPTRTNLKSSTADATKRSLQDYFTSAEFGKGIKRIQTQFQHKFERTDVSATEQLVEQVDSRNDNTPSEEVHESVEFSHMDFVGRKTEFKKFDEAWSSNRLFGIFGKRSVGKSRCVKEYLKTKDVHMVHVDLQYIDSVEYLHSNICALFGKEPQPQATNSDQWIKQIISDIAHASRNGTLVIYFDNAEDAVKGQFKDKFQYLLNEIVRGCSIIKLFITSTTRIQFSQLRYFSYELHPLVPSEAKQLLQTVAPGVDLGENADVIIKLSEGLPLMILMIGAELKEYDRLLTTTDMIELLCECRLKTLSNEFYPEEDRIGNVYSRFIVRLSREFENYVTEADYILGSCDVQEAVGYVDTSTKQAGSVTIEKHMLNNYPDNCRLVMQGAVQEAMKTHFTLKDLPELRKKRCKVLTDVMRKISSQMGIAEYTRVYSEFAVEQPHVQKLLGEIKYTREDTYHFFIEIVSSNTPVIEDFMTPESYAFYDACLRLTEMYGRTGDKANVLIAVGSMLMDNKGDLLNAASYYQAAINILEEKGKTVQLAAAYQKMGWNFCMQERTIDAVKYLEKSLDVSMCGGPDYESLAMQSLNTMGIMHTKLGNFEMAQKYYSTCLNQKKAHLDRFHPSVGATINNMGILMDQKGDAPEALDYHLKALEIKRKSKAPVLTQVYSLSNVANAYNALGRYDDAHALLDEALTLIKEQKVPMTDTEAFIINTRGKVYAKANDLENAKEDFAMAVKLSRHVPKRDYLFMKRLVNLAEVQEHQKDYSGCEKTVREALKLTNKSGKNLQLNTLAIECLQCLSKVYSAKGEHQNYLQTLYDIETKCLRLERHCIEQNDLQKLEKVSDTLWDIRRKLEKTENYSLQDLLQSYSTFSFSRPSWKNINEISYMFLFDIICE